MKKVMNMNSVITLLLIMVSATAFAQNNYDKNLKFGIAVDGGIPVGDDDAFDASLGLDARLQLNVTEKTSLMATTGYTHLFSNYQDSGFIPAKLGFKSFFANSFYVSGEAGAAFGVNKLDETSFLWSPGIGYANETWDVSARYEDYSDYDFGQVALRIAYAFKL
ncbi:Outer membrane protein beta-barrel domain-containing protein [Pustulibacterium marinum]|uniref:Outer membrane protein beta-barrel domain-containing protein n=1 Tax=Pustulibacterium marinum TaxID=1224947 RepID=A0A1I7ETT5_9FLAO|nr:outer membrane beta-barrel protein [Pustulibacterium marinum]SFU27347.1 Outer membrane protein beta-barrel domain-containing protein [Pustulibacterium marinum]